METALLTIAHLAHELATVIWLGGIFLFPMVIMPAAGMALGKGPETGKFMGAFAKKFKPLAYSCMVLFLVTGVLMMLIPESYVKSGVPGGTAAWVLRIKIIIVAVMMYIGIFMGEVNGKRIGKLMAGGGDKEGAAADLAKYQGLQVSLAKVNVVLGFLVLLLTAYMTAMSG